MGGPRKPYPSDHRRYFRVMEDILTNPGYRSLRPDDRAIWIDILAQFNLMKAQHTGNAIVLGWTDFMRLMGARSRRDAATRASRLQRGVSVAFAWVDHGALILVPNYAKIQGVAPSGLPRSSAVPPAPSPSPKPKPRKKRRSTEKPDGKSDQTESPPLDPSSNRPVFRPGFWKDLLKAHPKERYDISEADILDWWDFIWIRYEAICEEELQKNPKKRINHQSRVRNWWCKATLAEIDEALEAGRRRRKHPDTARRQAEADAINAEADRRSNGSGFSAQFDNMLRGGASEQD